MASIGWAWALLLCPVQLHPLAASSVHADGNLTHHSTPSLCRPDQANTLLKLKQSFIFDSLSITTLPTWQARTDCCLWEGVGCSNSSGHVTTLDLSGFGLYSKDIDPVLFNLTSLGLLDLSMNDFGGMTYELPSAGFERLALLTHLNLSGSGLTGQVPVGFSKLTNLVSLDLSNRYTSTDDSWSDTSSGIPNFLRVSEPNFQTLVVNLSNLRELYLDEVSTPSSTADDCFKALAKSVPHLRVLSLRRCGLQGHIDPSLSRLHSLAVINLSGNEITPGQFPEFFMNFLNLRVLQLSGINLEGWLPQGVFQSKKLRVPELFWNPNLSGHMPNFSNATSLETLKIHWTNFSNAKSSYFSNFRALAELGLDGNVISRDSSFGMLPSLRKFVLTQLSLPRELESNFSLFEGLKNLRSLKFYGCDLSMTIPFSIGNLKNLTSLVIASSNITTRTLSAIAKIRNLEILTIDSCGCSVGHLPSAIGNMTSLERLDIRSCQLSGPIPQEIGTVRKLTSLVLPSIGLSGRIPSSIANLTQLSELYLEENYLSGEIPTSLFTLPALQYLDLSHNQLSGPILEFDGASSRLENIQLEMNKLSGQIPQSLLVLPNLTHLNVEGNTLMGSVDFESSLWRLETLTEVHLSHNKLTVTEGEGSNSSSTYPSRLAVLGLASCNMTNIPNLLRRLNHISYLDLSSNKISGDIPNWIWERWNYSLATLDLSHNKFTGIELNSYIIPFTNVLSLDLSSNRLKGQIPMPSSSAFFLDYSNNMFSSLLPNFTLYLSHTAYLKLSYNNISSHLPHSICNSPLESLDLSDNNFSGLIPSCLMEIEYLGILNLRENQFRGMLPSNIPSGCSTETIDLHGNKIEGQLPRALRNCTYLEVLNIGMNQIADTFPSWLGKLPNLRVLVLRSNKFRGSIGYYLEDEKSGEHFSSLQIIDLASNNFSGDLHPQWFEKLKSMQKYNNTGQLMDHSIILQSGGFYQDSVSISYKGKIVTFERILTTLTAIDISDNALEGTIPASIGNLVSLHVLNMSHNAFNGEIPPHLGSITALESLDLSSNMLSGEIPQELTNLTFLGILNLSNNQLDGSIPQSHQIGTFQNTSFDGNAGLCGPPLSKQCGTPDTRTETNVKSSGGVDVVLFLFVGAGFGVGFAAAIIVVKLGWLNKWFHILRIL